MDQPRLPGTAGRLRLLLRSYMYIIYIYHQWYKTRSVQFTRARLSMGLLHTTPRTLAVCFEGCAVANEKASPMPVNNVALLEPLRQFSSVAIFFLRPLYSVAVRLGLYFIFFDLIIISW